MKPTTDDSPDEKDLPRTTELARELHVEPGMGENHFNLMQLNELLISRPGEHIDLKLTEEGRQLIFKGSFRKHPSQDGGEIQAFLFDHALLLVRVKSVSTHKEYSVYRKPIPLEFLVTAPVGVLPGAGTTKRLWSNLIAGATAMENAPTRLNSREKGYPITFQHLGKRGYTVTLYASSADSRREWIEHIEAQQSVLEERSSIFTRSILCDDFFNSGNRVSCVVPIDGRTKLVYGAGDGIYVSERKPKEGGFATPKKVINVNKVEQIAVLENFSMLLLLAEKTLMSVPVEGLDPGDTTVADRRPKKVTGHTSFFKVGELLGRVLVCCVESSWLSSTVKVIEPLYTPRCGKEKLASRGILPSGHERFKGFMQFYMPSKLTSIHFLRSKLCVGCSKGFEVVELPALLAQTILNPEDASVEQFQRKENVKPIAIYRVAKTFLLNYSDFSFFVNRDGWRTRPDWQIAWEGKPTAFACPYPYLLAFDPSFIEIRNVETGGLVRIVSGKNIRLLHDYKSTRGILYAYEDESTGYDVIASLDFRPRKL